MCRVIALETGGRALLLLGEPLRRRPGQLPTPLVDINLQYGLTSHRAQQVDTLEIEDGRVELRAVTGSEYGRISDHDRVMAVLRIAATGT